MHGSVYMDEGPQVALTCYAKTKCKSEIDETSAGWGSHKLNKLQPQKISEIKKIQERTKTDNWP